MACCNQPHGRIFSKSFQMLLGCTCYRVLIPSNPDTIFQKKKMDNRRQSPSWWRTLLAVQPPSHTPGHKKRLEPGGPSEDDSQTPLLSSTMSSNNEYVKAIQGVTVSVVDTEASSADTNSTDGKRRRDPWWSYIWVSVYNY